MSGFLLALDGSSPWVELTGPGTDGLVFMKPLLAPRVIELAYEPGFQSPPHAHRVDEIFFVLHGRLSVNKHELGPGSVLYVPHQTKYGPEYALEKGAHILRVELWTSDGDEGHVSPRRAASKPWRGPMTNHGTPASGRFTTVPTPKERDQDEAPGILSAFQPDSWEKTPENYRVRRLLAPNRDIQEVQQGHGDIQVIASTSDVLIYVLGGQILVDGNLLTGGSTFIVPRGSHQHLATTTNEARYLKISLDGKAPTT